MQDRASFKTTPNFSCVSAAISVGMFNNFFYHHAAYSHHKHVCVLNMFEQ